MTSQVEQSAFAPTSFSSEIWNSNNNFITSNEQTNRAILMQRTPVRRDGYLFVYVIGGGNEYGMVVYRGNAILLFSQKPILYGVPVAD